jgi:hypothetical protein
MDKWYGAKCQVLIGILTIGLFFFDNITLGEAVILTLIGGMYNRLIRLDQKLATKEDEN